MSRNDQVASLEDLDKKLERVKTTRKGVELAKGSSAGMGYAFRLATEMVAALLVGGGIGWLLDTWLGTNPWGLLVFLFVGFVAGILNAFRTGQRINAG
ncbi:MAG: hypothetical protein CMM32_05885 [Rhodospirillaceae bacterium]|nr:hypothetical protein [Rhodospirillaceae bacterium]